MLYGWEGNCTSGITLAICHRLGGIPSYGLNGLGKGDEPKLHSEYYCIFILYLYKQKLKINEK